MGSATKRIAHRDTVRTHTRITREAHKVVESLESRILLTSNDAALLSALSAALGTDSNGLSARLDRLKDVANLGRSLPMIGNALNGLYSPKAQLDALLGGRLSGTYATLNDLKSALEGAAGIGDGIQIISSDDTKPDYMEMTVRFQRSTNVTAPLGTLGSAVNLFGIGAANIGSANIAVSLDFQVTLGAFLNGSNGVFYVNPTNDNLKVNATLSATNLSATARIGFIDVNVSNGAASLSADFGVDLTDTGGGDGRLTLAELTSSPISTTVAPRVGTNMRLEFDVASSLISGTKHLQLDWSDITQPATNTSNLATLGQYSIFNSLSGALITTGLDKLSQWAGNMNNITMLGRPLPIISNALKDALNLPSLLHSRLIDQVGSFNSVDTLRAGLEAVGDITGVTPTLVGNELRYVLNLNSTVSKAIPFTLGLADLPLTLNVAGFNLSANITGSLMFGLDISTGTFFFRDTSAATNDLAISSTINLTGINATGGVGFLGASVTGGSAQLTLNAGINLNGGNLTSTEFAAGVSQIGSQVTFTLGGSASVSLPISAPLVGIPSKTFTASWPDLANTSSITSNINEFTDFSGWQNVAASAFSQGLNQVRDYLTAMAQDTLSGNNLLTKKLPLLNKSLADLIDFKQFLTDALTSFTSPDASNNLPFSNSGNLLSLLQNIPGVGASNATAQASSDDIRYTLKLHKVLTKTVPINLGISSKIKLDTTGNITATLDTNTDITFGVSKSTGKFFILTQAGPQFTATGTVSTSLTAAASLGFLGVQITNGTATMNANASVKLKDPATDSPATPGRITSDEIGASPISALVDTINVGGGASLSLPLSVNFGSLSKSGTLSATWTDVTHPETFSIDTSQIQEMFKFNTITIQNVLDGLKAIPSMLKQLADIANFGKDLPFIGSNIGGLVKIADQFQGYIDTLSQFTTAQTLETALEGVL